MGFVNGSGKDSNSNLELKESMEIVKTDNMTNKSSDIADAVAEVKNLISKINNLLRHGPDLYQDPEYYIDLMDDEVIKRHGRECLEAAVRQVVKKSSECLAELSTKFTASETFDELYFNYNPRLRGVSVEVGYWVGWPTVWCVGGSEIRLVASSEAIMVRQLLAAMAEWVHPEADPCYIKEMYLEQAGAPIWVEPAMRDLSAEQFIAAATHEPMTDEEYMKKLFGNRAPNPEVKA
jgi:hypothetical protein